MSHEHESELRRLANSYGLGLFVDRAAKHRNEPHVNLFRGQRTRRQIGPRFTTFAAAIDWLRSRWAR